MPQNAVSQTFTAPPALPDLTIGTLIIAAFGATCLVAAAYHQRPVYMSALLRGSVSRRQPRANHHMALIGFFGLGMFLVGAATTHYTLSSERKSYLEEVAVNTIVKTGSTPDRETLQWEDSGQLGVAAESSFWRCEVSPDSYSPAASAVGLTSAALTMTCLTAG